METSTWLAARHTVGTEVEYLWQELQAERARVESPCTDDRSIGVTMVIRRTKHLKIQHVYYMYR
jgi:hypothetical protein